MLGYYIMSEDISGSYGKNIVLPAHCEYSASGPPYNITCKNGVKGKAKIVLTDACYKCSELPQIGGRSRRRRASKKRKSGKKRSIRRKRR
jgi:hypothetical protein